MQGFAGERLVAVLIAGRSIDFGLEWRLWLPFQKLATLRELLIAVPVAQQSVVADPLQAEGQNVQQEAADKLVRLESHGLLGVVVAVVLPAESDLSIIDIQEPIVRDRHTVGIAADVIEDLLWPSKRRFGVNDPFLLSQGIEISSEGRALTQLLQGREELEFATLEGLC